MSAFEGYPPTLQKKNKKDHFARTKETYLKNIKPQTGRNVPPLVYFRRRWCPRRMPVALTSRCARPRRRTSSGRWWLQGLWKGLGDFYFLFFEGILLVAEKCCFLANLFLKWCLPQAFEWFGDRFGMTVEGFWWFWGALGLALLFLLDAWFPILDQCFAYAFFVVGL